MLTWNADSPITKSLSQIFGAAGLYPVSLTSALVYKAVKNDDVHETLRLLRKCPAALQPVEEGRISPFFVAVIHGYPNCAAALAKHYPHLLADTDARGRNVLLQGMELGNFNGDHAETLIRLGADPNIKDAKGNSPLHYAVRSLTPLDFAGKLLDRQADIEARNNDGQTPLMLAATRGAPELVNFLLLRKADMEATDSKSQTAVMLAVKAHSFDNAVCLLTRGAKLDLDDESTEAALRVATAEMHTDFLKAIGRRQEARVREQLAQSDQTVQVLTEGTQAPVTAMKPLRLKIQ